MSRRFYNKADARKCANKYYNAMLNGELENVKSISVDEKYEEDAEQNYYINEGEAALKGHYENRKTQKIITKNLPY